MEGFIYFNRNIYYIILRFIGHLYMLEGKHAPIKNVINNRFKITSSERGIFMYIRSLLCVILYPHEMQVRISV